MGYLLRHKFVIHLNQLASMIITTVNVSSTMCMRRCLQDRMCRCVLLQQLVHLAHKRVVFTNRQTGRLRTTTLGEYRGCRHTNRLRVWKQASISTAYQAQLFFEITFNVYLETQLIETEHTNILKHCTHKIILFNSRLLVQTLLIFLYKHNFFIHLQLLHVFVSLF